MFVVATLGIAATAFRSYKRKTQHLTDQQTDKQTDTMSEDIESKISYSTFK